ncbi:MAG: ATP-binding protein [Phycisphaeraceae bacterium]|nr:ATP-binding protein [Phycisphaeraceae bacterium]MCW5753683.1 ATP-binding protein [Phycisphaeraceae bacterium]
MKLHDAQVRASSDFSVRASDRPRAASGRVDHAERLMERVRRDVGEEPCRRFFPSMARVEVQESGEVVVTVPTPFIAGLIDRRLGGALRSAAQAIGGEGRGEVRFHVDAGGFTAAVREGVETPGRSKSASAPARAKAPAPAPSRFRFETFLPLPANALALEAARSVSGGDGRFSPLFLHGPCGMGKTHLLQAMAHEFRTRRRSARVRCLTAEAFTNEFIAAMHAGTLDEFRRGYRQVDLLCIDDVHFLSNKKATQAELLHTFDAIDMHGKLVALASDEHPREIARLNTALASRFMSGPVVPIQPIDLAQSLTVLVELASRRGLRIDEAALMLVRKRFEMLLATGGLSIRAIEGELTQIEALARLMPQSCGGEGVLTGMHVARALGLTSGPGSEGAIRTGRPRRPVRMDLIIERTCAELAVRVEELMGRGRHKRVVLARAVCVLLAREFTNQSFPEIARAMGRPNHSTVITALRRIQAQMASSTEADAELGSDVPPGGIVGLVGRLRSELVRASV